MQGLKVHNVRCRSTAVKRVTVVKRTLSPRFEVNQLECEDAQMFSHAEGQVLDDRAMRKTGNAHLLSEVDGLQTVCAGMSCNEATEYVSSSVIEIVHVEVSESRKCQAPKYQSPVQKRNVAREVRNAASCWASVSLVVGHAESESFYGCCDRLEEVPYVSLVPRSIWLCCIVPTPGIETDFKES
jgi:hypothetical protein